MFTAPSILERWQRRSELDIIGFYSTKEVTLVPNICLIENVNGGNSSLAVDLREVGIEFQVCNEADSFSDLCDTVAMDAVLIDVGTVTRQCALRVLEKARQLKMPSVLSLPMDFAEDYDYSLNPDELILSPSTSKELGLRVKQAIYRLAGPPGENVVRIGELAIDLERYEVTLSGAKVALTYKEFQLLALLASNPGRVYTREALLSTLWGYDYLGGTRTVDVHIRRLRSKVEDSDRVYLETIWNVGYRFIVD